MLSCILKTRFESAIPGSEVEHSTTELLLFCFFDKVVCQACLIVKYLRVHVWLNVSF